MQIGLHMVKETINIGIKIKKGKMEANYYYLNKDNKLKLNLGFPSAPFTT